MITFATIIQQAWDHRRRRHRAIGVATLASAATVGIVAGLANAGSGSLSSSSSGLVITVAPSTVLSKAPYMGVSCPVANSIACDRVGLAVWLKRPAVSVTATIAGAHLALSDHGDTRYQGDQPRTAFDGFLQPANIVSRFHVRPVKGNLVYTTHGHVRVAVRPRMWFGDAGDYPAPVPVRLTIHEPGGRTVVTRADVGLATGWG